MGGVGGRGGDEWECGRFVSRLSFAQKIKDSWLVFLYFFSLQCSSLCGRLRLNLFWAGCRSHPHPPTQQSLTSCRLHAADVHSERIPPFESFGTLGEIHSFLAQNLNMDRPLPGWLSRAPDHSTGMPDHPSVRPWRGRGANVAQTWRGHGLSPLRDAF